MKPSRLLLAVATLALALLFTLAVPTAMARHLAPAPDGPAADTKKVVKSVDAAAGTVAIEFMDHKTTHLYKVDGGTTIRVNNYSGKLTDIQAGMEVSDFVERDPQTLDSIFVMDSASQ